MRSLVLALCLTLAACAPQGGLDMPGDNVAEPAEDAEPEVTNAAMGEGADLLPPMQIVALTGRCAPGSWTSGAIAPGGKRRRLTCDTVAITYLGRKPGYTDSAVSVLQKDETKRIELGAVWESPERLSVRTAKLGDGEVVAVRGSCTGRFERPADSYFESGGTVIEIPNGRDEPGKRETLDCTVSDLQGNPIGAISFSTR